MWIEYFKLWSSSLEMKSNDIILMYLQTRMVSVFPSNSLSVSLELLVGGCTYKIASVLIEEC